MNNPNKKLDELVIDMANAPIKPLYDKVTSILSKATKWSFGWQPQPSSRPDIPNQGWKMTLDNILSGSFTIEIYLTVQLKYVMTVSLTIMGAAFNIEQLGWTGIIPYADLEQNPFQERLAKVFPHNKENETKDLYYERIHEFIKQYPL
jgi:hypothetical protein